MKLRRSISKFAILIASSFVCVASALAQSDKAVTVITGMIAALGGKPFLDVREIQASGKSFAFKRDQVSGTQTFLDYIKFPDKQRTELGTYRPKPTQIMNGETGWMVNDTKIETLTAAEVKEFQTSFKTRFRYVARFILNRPGLTLQHDGTELVDFKRNDVIEFRDSGNLFRLFVDQQSHLPTKMEVRRAGESFIREEQFANWHDFQGIRTPLYIIYFNDGERVTEIRYDDVSYNKGFADSLFAPPAAR